jgi:hypothetical protein
VQRNINLVDLVKSFPTSIWLQNLDSIQTRTSHLILIVLVASRDLILTEGPHPFQGALADSWLRPGLRTRKRILGRWGSLARAPLRTAQASHNLVRSLSGTSQPAANAASCAAHPTAARMPKNAKIPMKTGGQNVVAVRLVPLLLPFSGLNWRSCRVFCSRKRDSTCSSSRSCSGSASFQLAA